MPSVHSEIGPSGASRWIQCPASVAMSKKVDKPDDSAFSVEGDMAHELAEIEAGLVFDLTSREIYSERIAQWEQKMVELYPLDHAEKHAEMDEHVRGYIDLIEEHKKALGSYTTVLLEQRMDTGVPSSWGTSDVVLAGTDQLEIIDLKYGKGVPVSAESNPQLMLYALGALDTFGDVLETTETVTMTIYQPRLNNISSWGVSADYLRRWRSEVAIPAAKLALGEDAPFGPSATACRWCKAKGICKPRAEKVTREDFGVDPTTLSTDELSGLLGRIPEIKAWCSDVLESALHRAYTVGEDIPGWKVVRSSGRRTIPDSEAATAALVEHGVDVESVSERKLKGITALEKIVGKADFESVLGEHIVKKPGSPVLAPESDRRKPITSAAEAATDFAD